VKSCHLVDAVTGWLATERLDVVKVATRRQVPLPARCAVEELDGARRVPAPGRSGYRGERHRLAKTEGSSRT